MVAGRPGAKLHLVGQAHGRTRSPASTSPARAVEWEPPPRGFRGRRCDGSCSRALLLPSASEGLPRIVIESFMRGRAVVGSRAGGIPDIVEDRRNGFLVPSGDAAALAAAIGQILDDDDLAARPRPRCRRERGPLGRDPGRVRLPDGRARSGTRHPGIGRKRPSRSSESRAVGSLQFLGRRRQMLLLSRAAGYRLSLPPRSRRSGRGRLRTRGRSGQWGRWSDAAVGTERIARFDEAGGG